MFCTNCGSTAEEADVFCIKCGEKIGGQEPAATSQIDYGRVRRLWNGRLGRLHFFTGNLFGILPIFVVVSIWGAVRMISESMNSGVSGESLDSIIGFFVLIAAFWWFFLHQCVTVRRCHDVGITGWFSLLTYIPYIGLIPGLYLLFKKGEEKVNSYGAVPKERGFLADVFNYKAQ